MTDTTTRAVKNEFKVFTGLLKASRSPDGKMRLHGVASSTTKDLHGDTMTQSAIADMERAANNNLTIYLNHEYRVPEDVAGSVEYAKAHIRGVDQDGNPNVDLDMDIVINDENPRAVQTFKSIEKGTKLGLSIGAMIPEGGAKRQKSGSFVIEHVDLLETSLVSIPANPRSWVEYAAKSLRSGGVVIEDVEPEVTDSVETEVLDSVEPDITDATVTVETPFANITVDTSDSDAAASAEPSQEAADSAPETEVADETAEGDDERLGDSTTRSVEPDARPLAESLAILNQTTRELVETRALLVEAQMAKAIAERERDAAVAQRDDVLEQTKQILDRVANSPLMRRAVVMDARRDFHSRFEGVYSQSLLNMLENTADD